MQNPDQKKIVFGLIFLHLAVVLPLAYILNVWADEASTLHTTEHGLFFAFQHVFNDEKQAPLYFLLLSLWRSISDSIFFARLFSVVCSVLAIKVFYDLAQTFWKDATTIFVTAIFALHPYLIWASLEIRLYSMVILFSVWLLKLFFEDYFEEVRKEGFAGKNRQILFIISSILSLYLNYYLGFLLVGCFLALLMTKRRNAAKIYFVQMLIVGLAIAPLLWTIKQQFAVRAVAYYAGNPLLDGIRTMWNHFLAFVLPTEIFPVTGELTSISFVRLWIVRLILLAFGFWIIRNRKRILDEKTIALTTICAVCGAFLFGVYLLLSIKYIEIRHLVNIFVPLILLLCLMLSKVFSRRSSWILTAVIYSVFFGYSIYKLYPNLAKRGDWARVGSFIEQSEKPNQPIIVFKNYDALALPYHYRGINKILPDEKFFDWELEAAPGTPDTFRKQIEFITSKIPADAQEIWLLTDETCQRAEDKAGCQPLEDFVQANYTIEDTKDFYEERVRLLRKK